MLYFYNIRPSKASQRCSNLGGVLFLYPMGIQSDKVYTYPIEIATLQKNRGWDVRDSQRTEHYIRNIGYYRLGAYLYPMLQMPKELHRYKADGSFQDTLNPYRFDKKLRLFLFNDIEKVEIALRSALTNIVTRKLAISSG